MDTTIPIVAAKTLVLFIDDDVQMRRLIRACLELSGYNVIEAATGMEGINAAIAREPGIIILDLRLPDMDGMDVIRRLREWAKVPIMVLSVRDRETDKILALDAGANDYITKPFSTKELLARLRVVQRGQQIPSITAVFVTGHLQVDLALRTVKVRGQPVKLSPTEYSLLRFFVQHAGLVLTHSQLLREVWSLENVEKMARLRVYVNYLREKIENDPKKPELLITVPGVGYRLEVRE